MLNIDLLVIHLSYKNESGTSRFQFMFYLSKFVYLTVSLLKQQPLSHLNLSGLLEGKSRTKFCELSPQGEVSIVALSAL